VEAWIYLNLENSITETNTSSAVSTEGFEKKTDSREIVYGTNGAIGCYQTYPKGQCYPPLSSPFTFPICPILPMPNWLYTLTTRLC